MLYTDLPHRLAYAPYEGIASDRKTDVRWQKRTHSRICFIIFNSRTDIIYTKNNYFCSFWAFCPACHLNSIIPHDRRPAGKERLKPKHITQNNRK